MHVRARRGEAGVIAGFAAGGTGVEPARGATGGAMIGTELGAVGAIGGATLPLRSVGRPRTSTSPALRQTPIFTAAAKERSITRSRGTGRGRTRTITLLLSRLVTRACSAGARTLSPPVLACPYSSRLEVL